MNAEQKRDVIARFLKADPTASNREVGDKLGMSHHTVADVRNECVQNGQIAQNEQPIERAKTVLRQDPTLTIRALAKKADIGVGTAQKAQKLAAIESNPETKSKPELKNVDPEQETKKKAERFRVVVRKTFAQWTKQWAEDIGLDAMKKIIWVEGQAWLKMHGLVRPSAGDKESLARATDSLPEL